MMREWLCDKEVASLTGLSIHTLRAARTRPNIKNVPALAYQGGRVVYCRDVVVEWAGQHGIQPSGPRQSRQTGLEPPLPAPTRGAAEKARG